MPQAVLNEQLLLDQHMTPTFVLDEKGKVAVWNRACEKLTGVKAADVVGTSDHWRGFYKEARPCLADLVLYDRIEDIDLRYFAVSDLPGVRDGISAENWFVLPVSGRRHYLGIEALRIRSGDGAVVGIMETVRDLSAMKTSELKLRDLAGLDALTGIANRRAFDECLAVKWRRAIRSRETISLIMIDIDHFKQFNDSLGHQHGDECLRSVSAFLRRQMRRAGDAPARYGGEEFAILLAGADKAAAAAVAENIRAAIEKHGFAHPASSVGAVVTVSIGVATAKPEIGDCADKLIWFADNALYRAKASGRNKVCHFDDDGSCPIARCRPALRVEASEPGAGLRGSCRMDEPKARRLR